MVPASSNEYRARSTQETVTDFARVPHPGMCLARSITDEQCFLQRFLEKTRKLSPEQIAQALHDVSFRADVMTTYYWLLSRERVVSRSIS